MAQAAGVQVAIHTDTLNEAGYLESTLAAIDGRPIHTYHTEGAGGGHAPDIIRVAGQPNVLPSSTNPTRPYTRNTLDEHLDMLMVCHHLNPSLPEDLAFAESPDPALDHGRRGRAARPRRHLDDRLGLPGDGPDRRDDHPHLADRARHEAAPRLAARRRPADNLRARRYVAKYTIAPAVTHGLDAEIGSVEPGKLADLVLWDPAFFGVRADLVLKGGVIAWAAMGDANASIPTPQPQLPRPMFGAYGGQPARLGVQFVSPAALEAGLGERWTSDRPTGRDRAT